MNDKIVVKPIFKVLQIAQTIFMCKLTGDIWMSMFPQVSSILSYSFLPPILLSVLFVAAKLLILLIGWIFNIKNEFFHIGKDEDTFSDSTLNLIMFIYTPIFFIGYFYEMYKMKKQANKKEPSLADDPDYKNAEKEIDNLLERWKK